MGREVGGGFKKEGTHVYLWLTHVDVWQKPSQYCKVIILQLKIKLKKQVWSCSRKVYRSVQQKPMGNIQDWNLGIQCRLKIAS